MTTEVTTLLPYAGLEAWHSGIAARPAASAQLSAEIGMFLIREARLLDTGQFEAWLDLWTHDGAWWVPLHAPDPSPGSQQSIAIDDLRRLRERVSRFHDKAAWAQQPRSRTVRSVTNVEAWDDGAAITVRSVISVAEVRRGDRRFHAGHQLHFLRRPDDAEQSLQIARKAIVLIDSDGDQPNLSFLL